jgi:hypothetical protein
MPFSRTPGIAEPDELKILESVFEEACRTSKIPRESDEAERIALKIMLLFQSGIDERNQLLEAAIKVPDAQDQENNLRYG